MRLLRPTFMLAWILALAGCATSGPTATMPSPGTSTIQARETPSTNPPVSVTPSPAASATALGSPTSPGSFTSQLYGYVVTSRDWSGTSATTPWDGSGAPGNGDTDIVDTLTGPIANTFAFGEQTTKTLDEFAISFRAANAVAHGCPTKPASVTRLEVDGAAAILDAGPCSGVFALGAYVIRAGRAYVFNSFGNLDEAAAQQAGFESLLRSVRFRP